MKITLNPRKPRNPLVAPALMRRAGSHRTGTRAARREGARQLQRELVRLKQHSP